GVAARRRDAVDHVLGGIEDRAVRPPSAATEQRDVVDDRARGSARDVHALELGEATERELTPVGRPERIRGLGHTFRPRNDAPHAPARAPGGGGGPPRGAWPRPRAPPCAICPRSGDSAIFGGSGFSPAPIGRRAPRPGGAVPPREKWRGPAPAASPATAATEAA